MSPHERTFDSRVEPLRYLKGITRRLRKRGVSPRYRCTPPLHHFYFANAKDVEKYDEEYRAEKTLRAMGLLRPPEED